MIKIKSDFPRLAVFALGLGAGILMCLLPAINQINAFGSEQLERYGQALVKSTARESLDAAFRQDLISLSAILENAAGNPGVQQAIIYNVEGRVLVQAGKGKSQLDDSAHTFQATISLQDSVAGVVVLSISSSSIDDFFYLSVLLGMAVLSLVFSAWLIIKAKVIVFESPRLFDKTDVQTASIHNANPEQGFEFDDSNNSINNSDEANSNTTEDASAYASLCVKNLAVLKQQLNGTIFRNTLNQLEQKINKVGQLYGAVDCRWEKDRYALEFKSKKKDTALFNAACAVRLMLDLAGITNRVPLDLSAQISYQKENTLTDTMPFVGLAVHDADCAFDAISERVQLLEINNDENEARRLIAMFYSPYADLLKKQIEQLKNFKP